MSDPLIELEEKLASIGLEVYHSTLAREGYSTWKSVMALSEEDLIELHFKPGHRRRLQRQIATDCGHPIADALVNMNGPRRNSRSPQAPLDDWSSSVREQSDRRESSKNLPQSPLVHGSSTAGRAIGESERSFTGCVREVNRRTEQGESTGYKASSQNEYVHQSQQYIKDWSIDCQSHGTKVNEKSEPCEDQDQMWEFINF
jgi:hypothetical protein